MKNTPIANKIPKELTIHNDTRIDNYYWLNERENSEVIQYLNEENAYTNGAFKPYEVLQNNLFEEMKGRIKEEDFSVPFYSNGYYYQKRYEPKGEYPIYERWKQGEVSKKQVLFDVNEMAKNHKFFKLSNFEISMDNQYVAYAFDIHGDRIHTIRVKNIVTQDHFDEEITNAPSNFVWANDNQTIFYQKYDKSLRSSMVYRHKLGGEVSQATLLYEELDLEFDSYIYKSKSDAYIYIVNESSTSSEVLYLSADTPMAEFSVFHPRQEDIEYSVEHYHNYFYITTNKDKATNFKLMKTPVNSTGVENWNELIPHREDALIVDIDIVKEHLIVEERKNAQVNTLFYTINEDGTLGSSKNLPIQEEVYYISGIDNHTIDTEVYRYTYSSLTTPNSVIEYNLKTGTTQVLKEDEVIGSFDKNDYIAERIWVTSRDGKKIPVSLVRRKDTIPSDSTPLLQYGYGSYGHTIDPYFSMSRLSLLDRGFIYVIAHIRGSQAMGRAWYEDGKFFHKKNTFNDFIDVSSYLIENKYTSAAHLYAQGGSAGGLLMGAVMNMAPQLYKGIIAAVPFVDVVTTMLDETLPLTTGEFLEWGNPKQKEYYDYMKSYSPYDNVEEKEYPNLLVTSGLYDSQVQYFEPAKWVAKLRDMKKDNNALYFKINMDVGHGGNSGRFEALKDVALNFTFLLMMEKKSK